MLDGGAATERRAKRRGLFWGLLKRTSLLDWLVSFPLAHGQGGRDCLNPWMKEAKKLQWLHGWSGRPSARFGAFSTIDKV